MTSHKSENYSNYIFIVLHGYSCSTAAYRSIKVRLEKDFSGCEVLIPKLSMPIFSRKDPVEIVEVIITRIDARWTPGKRIVLIGHSCGAILARKVYLCACGKGKSDPYENKSTDIKSWAYAIDRIILLAGMNRGWTVNRHLSLFQAMSWEIGIGIGKILSMMGVEPLIFKFKKGAPFITDLRLQWLDLQKDSVVTGLGGAMVVQLLGTIDDLVSPEDNIDMITGAKFFYLDIPFSGHKDVILMDRSEKGIARYSAFHQALTMSAIEMASSQTSFTEPVLVQRPEVTDVIFVIHGIRDAGYWTQKVARKVKALALENNQNIELETSSYGYFPMLPFLLPVSRKAKVEWLMDQYTENYAKFPKAEFSFIGHSNGTYLLAKALTDYPCCRFKNVVFAGSVVRNDYKWDTLFEKGRVKAAINFVATGDWVVAIFPKLFQTLNVSDLGSGGHDGFTSKRNIELKYVKGGHGAAIQENLWKVIANFILTGDTPSIPEALKDDVQNVWVKRLGKTALLVWAIILLILLGIGILLWKSGPASPYFKSLILAFYLIGIWKVLTKL
ncbi:alpha/beta hydrolase [Pedobacter sp. G11]|uniref:alpha/beta hydrolase n=1 Tax=Pedobacter sp. G11 TaxID=2482728 RepID=UPI000F5FBB2C|nr:alpha/beta hydrolase [Pedobacter sp. G11]AZI26441.1 alpha/beta hydrolase [Pedobacter sp. G11]